MRLTSLRAVPLEPQPAGLSGRYSVGLPPEAAGQWCRVTVTRTGRNPWWIKLSAEDAARGHVVREAFLGRVRRWRGRSWRSTLLHVPYAADRLTLHVFTEGSDAPLGRVGLHILTRPAAGLLLLLQGWRALPHALAGDSMGRTGRVRAILGQGPARAGEAPGYETWVRLYDQWGATERDALARASTASTIDVVVVGTDDGQLAATRASLDAQWLAPARIVVIDTPAAWTGSGGDWVLVMQAGEVLAPHALACFARARDRTPAALGWYADADECVDGQRGNPLFKPHADPWLLLSGLPTRGACLFRAPLPALSVQASNAETWRQALALCLQAGAFEGIPFVLTHVPVLASGVAVEPELPDGPWPSVSVIIPTSGRSGHMLSCLERLVGGTDYAGDLEILLAVSHFDAADSAQGVLLERAGSLPKVRVLSLDLPDFNYAQVNNQAVGKASGTFVLLLNDDVAPLRADWLQCMVALACGPDAARADVVGVRLLYGNGDVQHAGVILGLANLCEHAFRLLPRHQPGPHGLARVVRQVSAVTGACLLTRRTFYLELGGMDEIFAVALNDVDLCLRATRAGGRVALAAHVDMYHYESLSLGRHYGSGRAALEAREVRHLRDCWADVIANDPFYNRSASLEPGREFLPAFPPQITPISWIECPTGMI